MKNALSVNLSPATPMTNDLPKSLVRVGSEGFKSEGVSDLEEGV